MKVLEGGAPPQRRSVLCILFASFLFPSSRPPVAGARPTSHLLPALISGARQSQPIWRVEEREKHREERAPEQLDRQVCCSDHNNEGGKSGAEAIPGKAARIRKGKLQLFLSRRTRPFLCSRETSKLTDTLRVSWMRLSRDSPVFLVYPPQLPLLLLSPTVS